MLVLLDGVALARAFIAQAPATRVKIRPGPSIPLLATSGQTHGALQTGCRWLIQVTATKRAPDLGLKHVSSKCTNIRLQKQG